MPVPLFREEQLAQSTSYWSPQHVLGHGLHGQTFFAELDGKPCAVKRLPAGFLQLILPLATALAGLQHPCINTLLGWGSSASHAFLVSSLSPVSPPLPVYVAVREQVQCFCGPG